jgi:hypothetical protein
LDILPGGDVYLSVVLDGIEGAIEHAVKCELMGFQVPQKELV